jgi:putative hemolysin
MSSYAGNQDDGNWFIGLLEIGLVIFLGWALWHGAGWVIQQCRNIDWTTEAVVEHNHAVVQHGAEAEAVRNCLNQNGPFAVWQKPDGRFLRLCQLPDGHFGAQICKDEGCLHEITAYVKNKMTRIEQLIKYLENMGAKQIYP